MFYLISKPRTDDHSFFVFRKLMEQTGLSDTAKIYYMWSNPPIQVMYFLDNTDFSDPLVVIAIKDLLDNWQEFNHWHEKQQPIPQKISQIAQQNSNTQFLLFTSLENLHLEINEPNVHIVNLGGDLVNQKLSYIKIKPVLDKNFNSDTSFICLNRQRRDHRIVLMSYLMGRGYDKFGIITYLANTTPYAKTEPEEFLDRISWEFDEEAHTEIRSVILDGYHRLRNFYPENADDWEIYKNAPNDNVSNFNRCLRPRYRNSFVEIVSESSFCAPSFNVTEKTAHTFYGCNFPILLGGQGIVQHMRDLGLDLFDDVVDHGYDNMSNPFDRIVNAFDKNYQLLSNAAYAKQQWQRCQPRFEANVEKIRQIYNWYEDRMNQQFLQIAQKICIKNGNFV